MNLDILFLILRIILEFSLNNLDNLIFTLILKITYFILNLIKIHFFCNRWITSFQYSPKVT